MTTIINNLSQETNLSLTKLSLDELKTLKKQVDALVLSKSMEQYKIKHLDEWYEMCFTDCGSGEYDDTFEEFFLEHADPKQFTVYKGNFVGKNSTNMGALTTLYLMERGIYYITTEWGDWWRNTTTRKEPKSLEEELKVVSIETLTENYKNMKLDIDKFKFIDELTDFMHCRFYNSHSESGDLLFSDDNPYVNLEYDFAELYY